MSRKIWALLAVLPLAACNVDEAGEAVEETSTAPERDWESELGYQPMGEDNFADSMGSYDDPYLSGVRDDTAMDDGSEGIGESAIADPEDRPTMQVQVVLDRQGFGPGVIDGQMGISTRNALKGFQEANALEVTGELDDPTKQALERWQRIPATRVVTIPANWSQHEYTPVPDGAEQQAAMERLGYESLDERLAERFHTTVEVLRELNPNGRPAGASIPAPSVSASASPAPTPSASASAVAQSYFTAGQQVRVPNIGADRIAPSAIDNGDWQRTLASLGVGSEQPEVTRVVVDKSEGWLKGYDADNNLVAMFTVTTGSGNDPLPLGDWGITGVAYNPPFAYNPELFWDVPDDEEPQQLPPGPNGPVGVVWIDLTKEHYGIHGTPAPETIGRAQSHGCVRLTNWDAARLAGMVSTQTEVEFQA